MSAASKPAIDCSQAFYYFFRGEPDRAEEILKDLIQQHPTAMEPRVHLANLYAYGHQPEAMLAVLEPVIDSSETSFELQWMFFRASYYSGAFDKAQRVFAQLAASETFEPEVARILVQFALQIRQIRPARAIAQKAPLQETLQELPWIARISLVMKIIPATFWRAPLRRRLERYARFDRKRREKILLMAAWLADGKNADWPFAIALHLRHYRDVYDPKWELERNWHRTALQIDPQHGQAIRYLDRLAFDMERWDEVISRLETRNQTPLDPQALRLLAAGYTNKKRYEKAMPCYDHIMAYDPGYAAICQVLIHWDQKNDRAAQSVLQSIQSRNIHSNGYAFILDVMKDRSHEMMHPEGMESIDRNDPIDTGSHPRFSEAGQNPHSALPMTIGGKCPLCDTHDSFPVLWRDSITGWLRARCPHCRMISVQPVPTQEEITNFYQNENRENLTIIRIYREILQGVLSANECELKNSPSYSEIAVWDEDFDWNAFEASIPGTKRLLDIGCSTGRILAAFQRFGWHAEGIDPDPQSVAFACKHGLNARVGFLENLNPGGEPYHVISLIDVIEHLPDPRSAVRAIHEQLHPGGLLYIKTPMADSFPHGFLGPVWLESAEHLQFFTRRTLFQLLKSEGFEIVTFRQPMQYETPDKYYSLWKEQALPDLFIQWIERLNGGDTIRLLARKTN